MKDESCQEKRGSVDVCRIAPKTRVSSSSSRGRADAVVKTSTTIFVFEFKMANHGTAEDALAQIDSKNYLLPYIADGRKLVKIGAEFSETERTVSRWKVG